jgi:hypothetical protein
MGLSISGIRKPSIVKSGWSHYKSISKRIKDARTQNLIQIPNWYFPHSGFTGGLWLELQPQELKRINSRGRGGYYEIDKLGPVYRFLAPNDGIQEAHNHEWSTYETIFSKLLALEAKVSVGLDQAGQIGESLMGSINRAFAAGKFPSGRQMMEAIKAATAVDVPTKKIDAPLAYTNSPRRQFMVTFPLLSEGLKTNLVEIVKDISAYAAAKNINESYIGWPHLWSIQSSPRGILDIDLAACTSVQTTWQHPYRNGIPQRCELTLSFLDVSPLFAQTIRFGNLITISDNLEQNSFAESVKRANNFSLSTEIEDIKNSIKQVTDRLGYPSKVI